ncbi:hypothetical protein [Rhodoferax fermentans]|uniref:hypothetical protein n=1 Tax=Rhodoferax fermentans TaxID=28066 RepID=UPI00117BCB15|nr:hypothetical protein [Rhodoferax fermentans]
MLLFNVFGITINKMEKKITGRGGPGRGQGRKPLPEGEAMVPVTVKLLPKQRDKLKRLGGGPWIRGKIDGEKETEPPSLIETAKP